MWPWEGGDAELKEDMKRWVGERLCSLLPLFSVSPPIRFNHLKDPMDEPAIHLGTVAIQSIFFVEVLLEIICNVLKLLKVEINHGRRSGSHAWRVGGQRAMARRGYCRVVAGTSAVRRVSALVVRMVAGWNIYLDIESGVAFYKKV